MSASIRIALHAPCTAQAFRPSVTQAVINLAKRLSLPVSLPPGQTCCGLTALQAGHSAAALTAARLQLRLFSGYDVLITTSSACRRMFREHLPRLLRGQPEAEEAARLATACTSWAKFLVEHAGIERVCCRFEGRLAYFPTCHGDDEDAILQLLTKVEGAELVAEPLRQCCGYGNNLSWRHPQLAHAMTTPILSDLRLSHADLVVTGDEGCCIHLAPLLERVGAAPIVHIAEFLADYCGEVNGGPR
ncbi:MAG: (Fe-S)-binding protein [Caldilineae bacterium]|nr:MAG: (Fe-S)-binding protein [Caldilineae bacterium]